jgi:hypothetical protein
MTINLVMRSFTTIFSKKPLSGGKHIISYTPDYSSDHWNVKVPIWVHGDDVTVFVSDITGEKGRVIFEPIKFPGEGFAKDANDLSKIGIKDITFSLNEKTPIAFYIYGEGPSIEYEPSKDTHHGGGKER